MKKTIGKKIVALLVMLALTAGVATASTGTKTLTASYNNIKITIDGQTITPKNASGQAVEPFIVDGTTYLPVRAVAEALGKEVAWDAKANTVVITTPESWKNLYQDPGNYSAYTSGRSDRPFGRLLYIKGKVIELNAKGTNGFVVERENGDAWLISVSDELKIEIAIGDTMACYGAYWGQFTWQSKEVPAVFLTRYSYNDTTYMATVERLPIAEHVEGLTDEERTEMFGK